MELFLEFEDLHGTNEASGETNLWHCANRGIVSEQIVQDDRVVASVAQLGKRVHGKLTIEEGELLWYHD